MTNEQTERAWNIAKDIDFCMFVTSGKSGLWARPMSTIVEKDNGKIFMLTEKQSAKEAEIEGNPDVVLAYADKPVFLTIHGRALVRDERALVTRLWNPGAQAFWPQGPGQGDVVAIEITPVNAEYWEGNNSVLASVKFVYALATGNVVEAGDNEKVSM